MATAEDTRMIESLAMPTSIAMNPTMAKYLRIAVAQRITRLERMIREYENRKREDQYYKSGLYEQRKFERKTMYQILDRLEGFHVDEKLMKQVKQLEEDGIDNATISAVVAAYKRRS